MKQFIVIVLAVFVGTFFAGQAQDAYNKYQNKKRAEQICKIGGVAAVNGISCSYFENK